MNPNIFTDSKSKKAFVDSAKADGHEFVKVRFKSGYSKNIPDEDLYIVVSHRRGVKPVYSFPCPEYINNSWPQRAFHLKCSFDVLLDIVDIYDEKVLNISKDEALLLINEDVKKNIRVVMTNE